MTHKPKKSYERKAGEKKLVGKSNVAKGGSGYMRLTTTGVDQDARTPDAVYQELGPRFFNDYDPEGEHVNPFNDPCPAVFNAKGDRIKPDRDALVDDSCWDKFNYINPPFKLIRKFLPRAMELQKNGTTSVMLIPFRPTANYFLDAVKLNNSKKHPGNMFIECIQRGVGFKGYSAKIPHAMSFQMLLGKDVKATKKMYGGHKEHKVAYVQEVGGDRAFDDAVTVCRKYGIPDERIHILVNSSAMADAGLVDDERMKKARKSWKDAYAALVPMYTFSKSFVKAMKECNVLAFSNPTLSNYAGESTCRFCSVLFIWGPEDKKMKKIRDEKFMNAFQIRFNDDGYMPSEEQLALAKVEKAKKVAKDKRMGIERDRYGRIKKTCAYARRMAGKKPLKVKKSAKSKKKASKKKSKKKSAKKGKKKSSMKRGTGGIRAGSNVGKYGEGPAAARKWVSRFMKNNERAPSFNTVRASFIIPGVQAQEIIAKQAEKHLGKKRKAPRSGTTSAPPAKKRKIDA